MLYIDLNMVRAGVVSHPKEWPHCGYNEIQKPRQRYTLIDYPKLVSLLQKRDLEDLQTSCREMVEAKLSEGFQFRDSKWSKSIAVGNKAFIEATVKKLGFRATGRKIIGWESKSYELREPAVAYGANFGTEKDSLRPKNTYLWNDSV
jgi:putative transposase